MSAKFFPLKPKDIIINVFSGLEDLAYVLNLMKNDDDENIKKHAIFLDHVFGYLINGISRDELQCKIIEEIHNE